MPSAWAARSRSYISRPTASASACGWRASLIRDLLAFELGSALRHERVHAFAIILGASQLALQIALEIELRVEHVAERGCHRALDLRQSFRRAGGELPRDRPRGVHQLRVFDASPNQSPALGVLAGELVAEKSEPHRAGCADEARQEIGAARVRPEPDFAEGFHEARRARSEDDVARKRDVGASAGSDAVDCAHNGPRQLAERPNQRVVMRADRIAEVHGLCIWCNDAVRQVLTGAKTASGPSEEHRANVAPPLNFAERIAQAFMHLGVEAVESIGPVERDRGVAVLHFKQDTG